MSCSCRALAGKRLNTSFLLPPPPVGSNFSSEVSWDWAKVSTPCSPPTTSQSILPNEFNPLDTGQWSKGQNFELSATNGNEDWPFLWLSVSWPLW